MNWTRIRTLAIVGGRVPAVGLLAAVILALQVALIAGCAGRAVTLPPVNGGSSQVMVVGSGKMVTRQVDVGEFADLDIGSALKVDVSQGGSHSVTVTADDNVIEYVDASKVGTTLRLVMKNGSYNNTSVRVAVVMPDIKSIRLGGASKGAMSSFKLQDLEVRLAGASQLTGRLESGKLDLNVAQASNLNLGGTADGLKLSGSGSSQASLGDLSVGSAAISLREASTATVNVRERLDADLRSASNLFYVGNPTLGSVTSVEASSVRRR